MKNFLMILGGFALLTWLLKKDKFTCPRCNFPVEKINFQCPNCGQPLDWRNKNA